MVAVFKVIALILFSGTKFFVALPATVLAGYTPLQTILITCTGGIFSFFFFFYFGDWVRTYYLKFFSKKEKIHFSKRNRFLVKIKNKYGRFSIAFISPCILGIPIGALLSIAFFGKNKQTIYFFVFSIIFWSVLLSYGLKFF